MIQETKLGGLGAVVYTPDHYEHKPGTMAWLFVPGAGELYGIENLYKHNTLGFIRDHGFAPDFIVAAISPARTYIPASAIDKAVSELKLRFPGCQVVLNGLSLGAWAVVNYVNSGYGDNINGLVFMSAPQTAHDNLSSFKGKPVISFLGMREPSQFSEHHPKIVYAFQAAGAAVIHQPVEGMGHGPWASLFDPAYDIADTRYGHNNIYEYMRKLLATAAGEPDTPLPAERKLTTTIKIYNDGHIEVEKA